MSKPWTAAEDELLSELWGTVSIPSIAKRIGRSDCDSCNEFVRIREQYCKRCGATFYERADNDFCEDCRKARKKAAQRKYVILTKRGRL